MDAELKSSFADTFVSALNFFRKTDLFEFEQDFASILPGTTAKSSDLNTFLDFIIEAHRNAFLGFLKKAEKDSCLFLTFQTSADNRGKRGSCSAVIKICEVSEEKICMNAVNTSFFMPGNLNYHDLKNLVDRIEDVRTLLHDLNNQFQIIIGYGLTLETEIEGGELKECASYITTSANKAVSINKELRQIFSQIKRSTAFIPEEMKKLKHNDEPDQAVVPENLAKKSSGDCKILVIDDEPMVRKFLCDMLKRFHYHPTGISDGISAIEALKSEKNKFALVILDMSLPDIASEKVFLQLRELSPDTRIMLISGDSPSDSSERMMKNGASAFLQKPVNVKTLDETIKRIMNF
ncbi:MAG: response regulator [Candidatus Riflebacteria bacterium]